MRWAEQLQLNHYIKERDLVESRVESVAVGWRKRNHSVFRVFTHCHYCSLFQKILLTVCSWLIFSLSLISLCRNVTSRKPFTTTRKQWPLAVPLSPNKGFLSLSFSLCFKIHLII